MPDNYPDKEIHVEYVEAEPLDNEAPQTARPIPRMTTYHYSGQGCVPCCGPFGCMTMLLLAILIFDMDGIARFILYFMAIIAGIFIIAQLLAPRR